ncbi:MAG: type II secretion system protein [Phycisphaerales bacterium]
MRSAEKTRRRGFTLIELLVVISIIGLLVGLLMPGLARARASGQNIKCLSNLKQIATALTIYMPDNRDDLPYVLPLGSSKGEGQDDLLVELEKYVTSTEIFSCPSDDTGVSEELGSSYDYWPGWIMFAREIFRGDSKTSVARTVTKFYERTPGRWPVMADAEAWHLEINPSGKNASYWDGSADALIDWTDPKWRDRLGGS